MKKTVEYDVVVMGSGVAGMGAAYKLANAGGLKIAVFEKYPAQGGAVSNCPMMFCSTPDTPEAQKSAFQVLCRFSNYSANMALVSKLVKYSSELPDLFLNKLKIESPLKVDRDPSDYGNKRGYTMGHANGLDVGDIYFINGRGKGHGMSLALLRLRLMLEKQGVDFYFSTPIKKIIRENGKITGAVAFEKDGTQIDIQCKALIVASGGITGNLEMMKEEGILNTRFEEAYHDGGGVLITFPDSCQDGDGQKAVWEIGGKKTPFTISGGSQPPNPGVLMGPNTPWLAVNQANIIKYQPYLWVNEYGKRFINEEMTSNMTAFTTATINNNPNMASYMIFDEDTAKSLAEKVEDGYVYFIFQGMKIENIRGQIDTAVAKGNKHMWHADTIKEICDYMGIDEEGLKKTLARYNHACETGYDEDFKKNPLYLKPVREESGHIYCFRLLAGSYDTLGGLAIDENANVLDTQNHPIEGLYAGGDMVTGSIYGNPPSNAGPTVYGSMPTGMIAGDSAAAYVKGEF